MSATRLTRRAAAIAVSCVVSFGAAGAAAQTDTDPRDIAFWKITDDIHVAYRPVPLRYWVEGNVTIILNENDVVVVEGSGTDRSAEQVIAYIRGLTENPVTVLINTHGHGDHTIGNSVYARTFPGIQIVARPETREYLTGRGIGYVESIATSTESRKEAGQAEIERVLAEKEPGYEAVVANLREYYERDIDIRQEAYSKAEIVPPNMIVDRRLVLHRGERTIDVRYLGAGDTKGDLIVLLPEDGMVATGDMVVYPFPYGYSRHPLEWLVTLDSLAGLEFDLLIPGHGEVQEGKAYLADVRELLRFIQTGVRSAVDRGLDREAAAASVDLSGFKDQFAGDDPVVRYYFDEYFAAPNVRRTYDAITADR